MPRFSAHYAVCVSSQSHRTDDKRYRPLSFEEFRRRYTLLAQLAMHSRFLAQLGPNRVFTQR